MRGEQRARRRVARDRNQIVHRRTVEDAETGLPHQPQVKRSDVGVADEDLWIAAEDFGLEIWNHSRCAVSAGSADHGFDARVEPHPHEVRGAPLVLLSREAPELEDIGIEDDLDIPRARALSRRA